MGATTQLGPPAPAPEGAKEPNQTIHYVDGETGKHVAGQIVAQSGSERCDLRVLRKGKWEATFGAVHDPSGRTGNSYHTADECPQRGRR